MNKVVQVSLTCPIVFALCWDNISQIRLSQVKSSFCKKKFQVSRERGEELAIEYGIKFMETSAKASINVEEAFFTLARDIKAKMEKKIVSLTKKSIYRTRVVHG